MSNETRWHFFSSRRKQRGEKGTSWRGVKKIRLSLFIYIETLPMLKLLPLMMLLLLLPLCEKLNLVMLVHKSIGHQKTGLWINRMILFNWIIIGFRAWAASYHRYTFRFLLLSFRLWASFKPWNVEVWKKRVSGYYKPIKADKWRNEFSFRFGVIFVFRRDRENTVRESEKRKEKARSHINLKHAKRNPHTNFSGVKAMYSSYVCF